jgi:hypothetical protein
MTQISDIDVHSAVNDLIVRYPPLAHDRAHIHYGVNNGHVVVSGNMKSHFVYDYFLNKLPSVRGVQSVDHSRLYDDDEIRKQVARLIPSGLFINVEYGVVKLTGALSGNITPEELVKRMAVIPGITRIVTAFKQG